MAKNSVSIRFGGLASLLYTKIEVFTAVWVSHSGCRNDNLFPNPQVYITWNLFLFLVVWMMSCLSKNFTRKIRSKVNRHFDVSNITLKIEIVFNVKVVVRVENLNVMGTIHSAWCYANIYASVNNLRRTESEQTVSDCTLSVGFNSFMSSIS